MQHLALPPDPEWLSGTQFHNLVFVAVNRVNLAKQSLSETQIGWIDLFFLLIIDINLINGIKHKYILCTLTMFEINFFFLFNIFCDCSDISIKVYWYKPCTINLKIYYSLFLNIWAVNQTTFHMPIV